MSCNRVQVSITGVQQTVSRLVDIYTKEDGASDRLQALQTVYLQLPRQSRALLRQSRTATRGMAGSQWLPGAAVGAVTMTRTNHTLVCVPDIFEEQNGEGLPIF